MKLSNAGYRVELPYSIQVLCTFMFGADFKEGAFLSLAFPEKCCAKATHCSMGMLRDLGNFSIQLSASASDLGLSPLKTTITP